jgi:hypothetical protein
MGDKQAVQQATRLELYVSSATMVRRRGLTTDISGFTFVTLASSTAEARGAHVTAAQEKFPGYAIEGAIATDPVDDDCIRAAALHLGMTDA